MSVSTYGWTSVILLIIFLWVTLRPSSDIYWVKSSSTSSFCNLNIYPAWLILSSYSYWLEPCSNIFVLYINITFWTSKAPLGIYEIPITVQNICSCLKYYMIFRPPITHEVSFTMTILGLLNSIFSKAIFLLSSLLILLALILTLIPWILNSGSYFYISTILVSLNIKLWLICSLFHSMFCLRVPEK